MKTKFFVYILYSLQDHQLYKGFSTNIPERFIRHNQGNVHSTKYRKPLLLIYLEEFYSRREAFEKEKYYKTAKGNFELKQQLQKLGILDENKRLKA